MLSGQCHRGGIEGICRGLAVSAADSHMNYLAVPPAGLFAGEPADGDGVQGSVPDACVFAGIRICLHIPVPYPEEKVDSDSRDFVFWRYFRFIRFWYCVRQRMCCIRRFEHETVV